MNEASAWRLRLGQRIAPTYARCPKVAATGIAGSVARGHADRYSDIELFVYWSAPPTDADRVVLAEEAGATHRRDYGWDEEYREWAEEYQVHGVKIDVTHYPVATIQTFLDDVLLRFDTAEHKTDQLAQLRSLIPLSGHELIRRWHSRAAQYPRELALAIVRQHLEFGPRSWVELLAARDDVLALATIQVMALRRILTVLEALNHIYHRPGDKWIDHTVGVMHIKPHDLSARIKTLFRAEPQAAVMILHELMAETIELVEAHLPEIETAPIRARIASRRPVWDDAPDSLK